MCIDKDLATLHKKDCFLWKVGGQHRLNQATGWYNQGKHGK